MAARGFCRTSLVLCRCRVRWWRRRVARSQSEGWPKFAGHVTRSIDSNQFLIELTNRKESGERLTTMLAELVQRQRQPTTTATTTTTATAGRMSKQNCNNPRLGKQLTLTSAGGSAPSLMSSPRLRWRSSRLSPVGWSRLAFGSPPNGKVG